MKRKIEYHFQRCNVTDVPPYDAPITRNDPKRPMTSASSLFTEV